MSISHTLCSKQLNLIGGSLHISLRDVVSRLWVLFLRLLQDKKGGLGLDKKSLDIFKILYYCIYQFVYYLKNYLIVDSFDFCCY